MSDGVRFIRKNGRIIPIAAKGGQHGGTTDRRGVSHYKKPPKDGWTKTGVSHKGTWQGKYSGKQVKLRSDLYAQKISAKRRAAVGGGIGLALGALEVGLDLNAIKSHTQLGVILGGSALLGAAAHAALGPRYRYKQLLDKGSVSRLSKAVKYESKVKAKQSTGV